jgi:hypothetical protein
VIAPAATVPQQRRNDGRIAASNKPLEAKHFLLMILSAGPRKQGLAGTLWHNYVIDIVEFIHTK